LRTGGNILSVEPETGEIQLELFVKNAADQVIIPGTAVVNFTVE
jgi:hypothetical protein